jgi:hypothetical protein
MANDAAKIKYGLEIRRAPGSALQSENEADIRRTDRGPSSSQKAEKKSVRYVLIIAMLLWSMPLAHAEPLDRNKWVKQTGIASKSCLAKFRQKFGNAEGHNYADCITGQTNKEIDTCTVDSEFSNCVFQRSLRVLEQCDLSKC